MAHVHEHPQGHDEVWQIEAEEAGTTGRGELAVEEDRAKDRDLRSARPDDRTIVENFVVRLCA